MRDEQIAWLKAEAQLAFVAPDLVTVDMINSIIYQLTHLQAVADAAARVSYNSSNDEAWTALVEALASVDTTTENA
jgi:hypothetical protein